MSNPDEVVLTLEQKASLLSGTDFWSTTAIDEAGIPSVLLTDGPHGIRLQDGRSDNLGLHGSVPATCFPPAVAVGSSWDPILAEQVGAAVGREARALGVSVVLGPGVNIKRSPLGGRNFEYYSEDPLLSGVMGAAHVRGQQGEGVGASVKHFAVNNQETERMRVSADVDDRTLREIYLPAFERVVTEAHPATVMCAYNKINGVSASENRWLLTDVLRKDWGFDGVVVSDWGAVTDRVAALAAGLDLEMPGSGGNTDQQIVDAVNTGVLSEAVVDDAVRRISSLATKAPREAVAFDIQTHHDLARTIATECAVLLKNDGNVLPLVNGERIAVLGDFAAHPRYQGGGSSRVNATRVDSALEALRELGSARGHQIRYAAGYGTDPNADQLALIEEAVRVAADSDVAIVFVGLSEEDESEGFDRATLDLPTHHVDLIRAVAAAADKTVVVLSNGGVVSLDPWHDEVDAILEGFILGQAGGSAVADLLCGVANPCGHLAETMPLTLRDAPSYLNFPGEQGHVRYGEGVMVGYRHYETVGAQVRYPFGHGLSYSTFEVNVLGVAVTGSDSVQARVSITNTGTRAGKYLLQVYVSTEAGPVRRPERELRAFQQVLLEGGETRDVEFTLDRRAFAFWDITRGDWTVTPGDYRIQFGRNAAAIFAEETVTLTGDVIIPVLTVHSTVEEWMAHPEVGTAFLQTLATATIEGQEVDMSAQTELLRMVGSMPIVQFNALIGNAVPMRVFEQLAETTSSGKG